MTEQPTEHVDSQGRSWEVRPGARGAPGFEAIRQTDGTVVRGSDLPGLQQAIEKVVSAEAAQAARDREARSHLETLPWFKDREHIYAIRQ